MLAQSFMSASDLGLTESQRDALQKVLVLLETGKLKHADLVTLPEGDVYRFSGDFNMAAFAIRHTCGTACCIAGTAELISGVKFVGQKRTEALEALFYGDYSNMTSLGDITPAQAARALRSYLTTGDAKWDEALA